MAKRSKGYDIQELIDICRKNKILELQFGEVRLFFDEPRKEIQAISQGVEVQEDYDDEDDLQEDRAKPKPLRPRKRVRRH